MAGARAFTRRPRVLLAWELGDGYGHVGRLASLAQAFAREGFEPVMALRDPIAGRARLRDLDCAVLQAPLAQPRRLAGGRFHARSFADILALVGYDDAPRLRAMVATWRALVDLVAPELVVGDFSPTAALALAGRDTPLIAIGSGFALPPRHLQGFPVVNPDGWAITRESSLHASVAAALGCAAPPLPGLVGGTLQFACTWPALDPYRDHRAVPAAGPLASTPAPRPRPATPGWFAYLAADAPNFAGIVDGLLASRHRGVAVLRHADPALAARFAATGKILRDDLPDLADMLGSSAVVVHHGGIGTAETAFAMGVPQLVLSRHLEQQLTGRALATAGVGCDLSCRSPAGRIAATLDALVEDDTCAAAAAHRAALITRREGARDDVVTAALALARRASAKGVAAS